MSIKYREGEYEIDCTDALWSTNSLNKSYHAAGVKLKDVDWIIEDDDFIYLIEYKNALVSNVKNPSDFNPNENKTRDKVIQKYYDSLHFLTLLSKTKRKKYIYVVEAVGMGDTMRKKLKKNLISNLPFKLQNDLSNTVRLIESLDVMSIDDWNNHPIYSKYPIMHI